MSVETKGLLNLLDHYLGLLDASGVSRRLLESWEVDVELEDRYLRETIDQVKDWLTDGRETIV